VGRAAVCLSALAALALPATVVADPIGKLRASSASLAASERAAVLQLYAIDTRLDRARGELAQVAGRLAGARRRQDDARRLLAAARRSLTIARRHLGEQLRALYETDEVDALAVILGSSSLDDVITNLDSLSRAARSSGAVIGQVDRAERRTIRLLRSLERRTASLARLRASAAARATELAAARSERSAYIGRLRDRERLTRVRIAALERQARAAEAAATVATVKAQAVKVLSPFASTTVSAQRPVQTTAAPPAPPPAAPPAPVEPASGSRSQLTVVATAYSLPGHTASGLPVGPGVVAVDPTVIPLGTRLYIPGYGQGIAADTGTAIKGLRIDLWFPTLRQAREWGAHTVTITVY
jgi:3D (Asp-Asp-Asp) domain-containing protein